MEQIVKIELEAIEKDVDEIIMRAEKYRKDAECRMMTNYDTSRSVEDQAESLFGYLEEAKDNLNQIEENIKSVGDFLNQLLEDIEYESIRQRAIGES